MFLPKCSETLKGASGNSIIEIVIANSLLFGLLIMALFPVTISSGSTRELSKPAMSNLQNDPGLKTIATKKQKTLPSIPRIGGFKLNLSGQRAYVSNSENGLNEDEVWVVPIALSDYQQSHCRLEQNIRDQIYCYLKTYPATLSHFTQVTIKPVATDHFRLEPLTQIWGNIAALDSSTASSQFENWILLDSQGNAVAANTILRSTGKSKTVQENDTHRRVRITSRVSIVLNNGDKTQAVYQTMPGVSL